MFITKRTYYALEILKQMDDAAEPLSVKAATKFIDRSVSYLEIIFKGLKEKKIVQSIRGPNGGYILARPLIKVFFTEVNAAAEQKDPTIGMRPVTINAMKLIQARLSKLSIKAALASPAD